jgi:hypothetical protein
MRRRTSFAEGFAPPPDPPPPNYDEDCSAYICGFGFLAVIDATVDVLGVHTQTPALLSLLLLTRVGIQRLVVGSRIDTAHRRV